MSLSATLANAFSGLTMAQRSLATVSNNIANVNTAGYTKKTTTQEAVVVGGQGMGVAAGELKRSIDLFLQSQQRVANGDLGKATAINDVYTRLQLTALGSTGGDGLGDLINSFSAAIATLANSPDSATARSAAVSAANAVAASIGSTADQLQTLRAEADGQIASAIDEINDQLQQLEDINRTMARGTPSADLADRRDALLDSLASKLDIKASIAENGTVQVFAPSGSTLLDDKARVLSYVPAASVGRGTVFSAVTIYTQSQIDFTSGLPKAGMRGIELISSGVRADASSSPDLITSSVSSGSLAGLLEVRDDILPGIDDQLVSLASQITSSLNAVHNAATTSPPPSSLTSSRTDTSSFSSAEKSGSFALAIIDDGSGATLNVATLDLASYGSMTDLVADLNDQLGSDGSASIGADGKLVITAAEGTGLVYSEPDAKITSTGSDGITRTSGLAQYLGLNDLFTVSANSPTSFAIRSDIAADPGLLANATVTIGLDDPNSWSVGGVGDGSGFQALAAAFSATEDIQAYGNLPRSTASFVTYAASIGAQLANDSTASQGAADAKQDLSEALAAQQSSISGVNVDEELTLLISYQQAYAAAARIIQVSSDLFDDLFSAVS